jgi:hypothetical protein
MEVSVEVGTSETYNRPSDLIAMIHEWRIGVLLSVVLMAPFILLAPANPHLFVLLLWQSHQRRRDLLVVYNVAHNHHTTTAQLA